MIKNTLIIILLFQWVFLVAQSATRNYDLKVAGIQVGNLQASKQIQGSQEIYTADSEALIRFFGKHSLKTHLEVVYENDTLKSSTNIMWKDGELYDEISVKNTGENYQVIANGKESILNHPINYSSVRLYFDQPTTIQEVFIEPDGAFTKIIATKSNEFRYIEKGKKTNKYTYNSAGVLEKAVFKGSFFNVSIILKQS